MSAPDFWSLIVLVVALISTMRDWRALRRGGLNARPSHIAGVMLGIYVAALYILAMVADMYIIRSGILSRLAMICLLLLHMYDNIDGGNHA